MNEQVLSIEQMQHLVELGVDTSKASMAWCKTEGDKGYHLLLPNSQKVFEYNLVVKYIPTFTLQDMINLMPKHIGEYTLIWYISDMIFRYERWIDYDCYGRFDVLEDLSFTFNDNVTILGVACAMLCKLAEGGYLNKK